MLFRFNAKNEPTVERYQLATVVLPSDTERVATQVFPLRATVLVDPNPIGLDVQNSNGSLRSMNSWRDDLDVAEMMTHQGTIIAIGYRRSACCQRW